mmetsp:Transcript_25092/g.73656  ORF Transcript_25092/g.73656 Transcript_25092/m.73656 type:complete len:443 (+) Transcript_25092:538-1866(+)
MHGCGGQLRAELAALAPQPHGHLVHAVDLDGHRGRVGAERAGLEEDSHVAALARLEHRGRRIHLEDVGEVLDGHVAAARAPREARRLVVDARHPHAGGLRARARRGRVPLDLAEVRHRVVVGDAQRARLHGHTARVHKGWPKVVVAPGEVHARRAALARDLDLVAVAVGHLAHGYEARRQGPVAHGPEAELKGRLGAALGRGVHWRQREGRGHERAAPRLELPGHLKVVPPSVGDDDLLHLALVDVHLAEAAGVVVAGARSHLQRAVALEDGHRVVDGRALALDVDAQRRGLALHVAHEVEVEVLLRGRHEGHGDRGGAVGRHRPGVRVHGDDLAVARARGRVGPRVEGVGEGHVLLVGEQHRLRVALAHEQRPKVVARAVKGQRGLAHPAHEEHGHVDAHGVDAEAPQLLHDSHRRGREVDDHLHLLAPADGAAHRAQREG